MTHSTVFKIWSIVTLVFFTSVFSLKAQEFNAYNDRIIQNIDSREKMTLDGLWQIIIDPLENGYYNHQYGLRNKKAFYRNRKMKKPSDLIEYDFF